MAENRNFLAFVKAYWKTLVFVLVPVALLPLPLLWTSVAKEIALCAYVVIIMGVYWVTEALPLTVTALIPLFAFPLLGVQTSSDVANAYVKDISFLFIGGLMFGVAVQEVMLHRRIALNILLLVGDEPRWLIAGIMITTAFLSMWISNTATTSMMVPVVISLASELIRAERCERKRSSTPSSPAHTATVAPTQNELPLAELGAISKHRALPPEPEPVVVSRKTLSRHELNLCKAMLLSVCYSASLGGTATLTGTLPNIVMTGLLDKRYGTTNDTHPINFATWMGYNCPGMVINLFLTWCWLQILFLGPRTFFRGFLCRKGPPNFLVKQILREQLSKLGPVAFGEWSVMGWFLVLLFLWLTRSFWWGAYFDRDNTRYVSDGTSAIVIACLLFAWPKLKPFRRFKSSPAILNWDGVEKRLCWGVIFLLGGGFAVGSAVQATGLSELLGGLLAKVNLSNQGLCIMSLILITYTTEFTSNTATSNIILPIIISLAESRCMNPLYLTMPTSEAASFAFMLPVATPPNAIVFASGVLRVTDMMLSGFAMNLMCMCEVLLSIHTWGWAMFNLGEYPSWAMAVTNGTCI